MNWSETNLVATTLPMPDVSGHPQFQGPDGVELWLAAFLPHLVRCEVVRNQIALAANPNAVLTAHFAVAARAEEYSATDGGKPIEIQYSVYYPIDFSCGGLVPLPPPPPVVAGVAPLSGDTNTDFTLTGTNFTGVTLVEIVGGPVGTVQSSSATQIVVRFPSAGSGPVRVTTAGGSGVSSSSITVEDNPPT